MIPNYPLNNPQSPRMSAEEIYRKELKRWIKAKMKFSELKNGYSKREFREIMYEELEKTENPFCVFNSSYLRKEQERGENIYRKNLHRYCPYYLLRKKPCYAKGELFYSFEHSRTPREAILSINGITVFLKNNKETLINLMKSVEVEP